MSLASSTSIEERGFMLKGLHPFLVSILPLKTFGDPPLLSVASRANCSIPGAFFRVFEAVYSPLGFGSFFRMAFPTPPLSSLNGAWVP